MPLVKCCQPKNQLSRFLSIPGNIRSGVGLRALKPETHHNAAQKTPQIKQRRSK